MASEPTNNQEIDLFQFMDKIKASLHHTGYLFYKFLLFLWKHIIQVAIVIAIGIGLGWYWDSQTPPRYKHEVIVAPNFGSTEYLYNEVENYSSGTDGILSVEIEPVIDIYSFVKERWNNVDVLKQLKEYDVDFTKYKPDSHLEKFFRYQLLTVTTDKKDDGGEIIKSFLSEINNDEYLKERQKIEKINIANLIQNHENAVKSIDKILNNLGERTSGSTPALSIEAYTDLNNLVSLKKSTAEEINSLKIIQMEQSEIVYEASKVMNIKVGKTKKIITTPILLFLIYLSFMGFIAYLKRYSQYDKGISES